MQMTVCGNVPLFQTDDDSEGMYFSTEQALSQHKAFIIEAKRGNSADTAPFLLVSGKGKALYNHQVSGCKSAIAVQAQEALLISSVRLVLISISFSLSFKFTCFLAQVHGRIFHRK